MAALLVLAAACAASYLRGRRTCRRGAGYQREAERRQESARRRDAARILEGTSATPPPNPLSGFSYGAFAPGTFPSGGVLTVGDGGDSSARHGDLSYRKLPPPADYRGDLSARKLPPPSEAHPDEPHRATTLPADFGGAVPAAAAPPAKPSAGFSYGAFAPGTLPSGGVLTVGDGADSTARGDLSYRKLPPPVDYRGDLSYRALPPPVAASELKLVTPAAGLPTTTPVGHAAAELTFRPVVSDSSVATPPPIGGYAKPETPRTDELPRAAAVAQPSAAKQLPVEPAAAPATSAPKAKKVAKASAKSLRINKAIEDPKDLKNAAVKELKVLNAEAGLGTERGQATERSAPLTDRSALKAKAFKAMKTAKPTGSDERPPPVQSPQSDSDAAITPNSSPASGTSPASSSSTGTSSQRAAKPKRVTSPADKGVKPLRLGGLVTSPDAGSTPSAKAKKGKAGKDPKAAAAASPKSFIESGYQTKKEYEAALEAGLPSMRLGTLPAWEDSGYTSRAEYEAAVASGLHSVRLGNKQPDPQAAVPAHLGMPLQGMSSEPGDCRSGLASAAVPASAAEPALPSADDDDPFTARNVHLWAESTPRAEPSGTSVAPTATAPPAAKDDDPFTARNVHLWAEPDEPVHAGDPAAVAKPGLAVVKPPTPETDDDGNPITSRNILWSEAEKVKELADEIEPVVSALEPVALDSIKLATKALEQAAGDLDTARARVEDLVKDVNDKDITK